MTVPNKDGAKVRFPPPLVFLGAMVLGVIVQHKAMPLSLVFARGLRLAAAVLILACGVSLVASARILFKRTGQNPIPWKPTPADFAGALSLHSQPDVCGGYPFCDRTWSCGEQSLDFAVRGAGAPGGALHRGVA